MRYLGLDLGTKTLGLALSDQLGMIATSYKILRHNEDYDSLIPMLKEEIEANDVKALVLGLPKNMNNSLGFAAERSENFARLLDERFHLPVHFVDERLTTVEAENILLMGDKSRKKRKKVIDNVASSLILETYLKKKGN